MTDTVDVPQEMINAVMKVAVGVDEYGSEVFPGPFVAAELVRAALAAAPKAEPAPCVSCEGRPLPENNPCHSCGAEIPKVEQEPVAMILKAPCQHCQRMTIVPNETLALYHPAPASDARVIGYEEAHATAVEMGYPSLTEALEDLERLQKDRDAFDGLGDNAPASDELLEALEAKLNEYAFRVSDYVVEEALELIAKHKGPQS